MTLRCAILDDYQDVALKLADWPKLAGIEVERFTIPVADEAKLAEMLRGFAVIIAMRERTPFRESLLSRLPDLRLLVTTGMRNASIDMEAAARQGVLVCGTGAIGGPAAELTWALLLALVRHLPAETRNFRDGGEKWQLTLGSGLEGRTLGIVGLGKLGTMVARYGLAFGMDVIAWSRSNTPEKSKALGIGFASTLDDLLKKSDVVSLHLVLNAETRGILGARELGLMKRSALLINTSRGPLVDEKALIAALQNGRLGGAGLDVFDHEPLPPDHPFRTLANVVATPHLGYVTEENYRIYFNDAVENIAAWRAGAPVRALNKPADGVKAS
ncbi:MAG: D-2-hydroxyacid dehydrogenase family protein [Rhizobiaceae bacterium]